MVSQIQQIRALLECVWPATLETAKQPFRSKTWAAAMTVICERDRGELARTRRLGVARFEKAVRQTKKLTATQAQTVAAAILRQLCAVITTGQAWDPHVATHGTSRTQQVALAA